MGRPPYADDMTGRRFGQLTVVSRAPKRDNTRAAFWLCKCDCGGTKVANGPNLRQGSVKSCGCLRGVRSTTTQKITILRRIVESYEQGAFLGLLIAEARALFEKDEGHDVHGEAEDDGGQE